jgi:hypothetical protein
MICCCAVAPGSPDTCAFAGDKLLRKPIQFVTDEHFYALLISLTAASVMRPSALEAY